MYYPPGGDDKLICDHLFQTLFSIESNYTNSGIILAGDFNRPNINRILKQFWLKQLVKVPTRNDAILDLVLTNLHDHYCSPESLPPFGLSDHNTLIVHPLNKTHTSNKKIIRMKRDHRLSRRAEFGGYLCSIDWSSINSDQNSCEEMWKFLYDVIFAGLDLLIPIKEINVSTTDAPWMNDRLKLLIKKRQQAFVTCGSKSIIFKQYRNLVNRERKSCRAKYYKRNIDRLKEYSPKHWWNEVKRISNFSNKQDLISLKNVETFSNLTKIEQANEINKAFLGPLKEYRLQCSLPHLSLTETSFYPEVSEIRLQNFLSKR